MIALFAFLSASFVIWRAVWAIPGKRVCLKLALTVLVLIAAFKFQILHFFGGASYFAPDLPRWILLTGAFIFSVHFIFFFLLLISEVLRFLARIGIKFIKRKTPETLRKMTQWINPVLFLCAVTFAAIGIYNGMAFPAVREVKFRIAGLPRSADGLKIAFITDLHVDKMNDPEWLPLVVARINAAEADLVVLGGDLMDGKVDVLAEHLLPLKNLRAKYGVYAVPGNHEYYSGFDEWMEFLTGECKITMLINRAVRPGGGITLMGIGDYAGKRSGKPGVNFRQAFKDVDADEKVILISHRPDLAREAEKLEVMLQLSGHTHGGMMWGLDKVVARWNGGFVSGAYRRGNTWLYVSNGTGIWSGFPVRIGVPSEITLIKLERD